MAVQQEKSVSLGIQVGGLGTAGDRFHCPRNCVQDLGFWWILTPLLHLTTCEAFSQLNSFAEPQFPQLSVEVMAVCTSQAIIDRQTQHCLFILQVPAGVLLKYSVQHGGSHFLAMLTSLSCQIGAFSRPVSDTMITTVLFPGRGLFIALQMC